MIDTKKLREALNGYFIPPLREGTLELLDELDRVTAERNELRAARVAYSNEFPLNSDGEPDVGNIHRNIRSLKAERDALKGDAERYRWLRDIGDETWPPFSKRAGCTGPLIDKAIDAAIRASEGDA